MGLLQEAKLNTKLAFGSFMLATAVTTGKVDVVRGQVALPNTPEPTPIIQEDLSLSNESEIIFQHALDLKEYANSVEVFPQEGTIASSNGELTIQFSQSILAEFEVEAVLSPPTTMDNVYRSILETSSAWGNAPIVLGQEIYLQVPFNLDRREINGGGDEIRGIFSGKISLNVISDESFDALLLEVNAMTDGERSEQNIVRYNPYVATEHETIGITAIGQLTQAGELVIVKKIPYTVQQRWANNKTVLFILQSAVEIQSFLGITYAQAQGTFRSLTDNFGNIYDRLGVNTVNLSSDSRRFQLIFSS